MLRRMKSLALVAPNSLRLLAIRPEKGVPGIQGNVSLSKSKIRQAKPYHEKVLSPFLPA